MTYREYAMNTDLPFSTLIEKFNSSGYETFEAFLASEVGSNKKVSPYDMSAEDVAVALEGKVNVMDGGDGIREVLSNLTMMHRTLLQSFVGKFIIPFVRKLAMDYATENYDTRNKVACEMCNAMFEGLCVKYGEMDFKDVNLPLI